MIKSHYHPPRCKYVLYISDEWIEYISSGIVKRAEQKVVSELQQEADSKTLVAAS